MNTALKMPPESPKEFDQDIAGMFFRLNYGGLSIVVPRVNWGGNERWRLIIGLLLADAWDQDATRRLIQAHMHTQGGLDAEDQAELWREWAHADEKDDRHLRLED